MATCFHSIPSSYCAVSCFPTLEENEAKLSYATERSNGHGSGVVDER